MDLIDKHLELRTKFWKEIEIFITDDDMVYTDVISDAIDKFISDLLEPCDGKESSDEHSNCNILHVVGRSESFVCGHPPKETYLLDGTWHCKKCGGKWESIANK